MGLGSRHRPYCWARLQTIQKWYVLRIFDKTNNHKIIIWHMNIFQRVISVSPWLKCLTLPRLIIMLIILVRIMLHIRRLLAAFRTVSIHTIGILILLLILICRFDLVVLLLEFISCSSLIKCFRWTCWCFLVHSTFISLFIRIYIVIIRNIHKIFTRLHICNRQLAFMIGIIVLYRSIIGSSCCLGGPAWAAHFADLNIHIGLWVLLVNVIHSIMMRISFANIALRLRPWSEVWWMLHRWTAHILVQSVSSSIGIVLFVWVVHLHHRWLLIVCFFLVCVWYLLDCWRWKIVCIFTFFREWATWLNFILIIIVGILCPVLIFMLFILLVVSWISWVWMLTLNMHRMLLLSLRLDRHGISSISTAVSAIVSEVNILFIQFSHICWWLG